jgi:hypothetical protein
MGTPGQEFGGADDTPDSTDVASFSDMLSRTFLIVLHLPR